MTYNEDYTLEIRDLVNKCWGLSRIFRRMQHKLWLGDILILSMILRASPKTYTIKELYNVINTNFEETLEPSVRSWLMSCLDDTNRRKLRGNFPHNSTLLEKRCLDTFE